MSKKKVPSKNHSGEKKATQKKNQNAAYIAVLVSLAVALVMVIGCAIWIVATNLPDIGSTTDSEQTSSSGIEDEEWTKNY